MELTVKLVLPLLVELVMMDISLIPHVRLVDPTVNLALVPLPVLLVILVLSLMPELVKLVLPAVIPVPPKINVTPMDVPPETPTWPPTKIVPPPSPPLTVKLPNTSKKTYVLIVVKNV